MENPNVLKSKKLSQGRVFVESGSNEEAFTLNEGGFSSWIVRQQSLSSNLGELPFWPEGGEALFWLARKGRDVFLA